MTKVFIGGSRHIKQVHRDVRLRIDRLMAKGLDVLVGDASGADTAVQQYLCERGYHRVEVFCSDDVPRNNLGNWPVRVVAPTHRRRDFDYYATKDRAMAEEADVGLMLWDGTSRGTIMNALRLLVHAKTAVVFIEPRRAFLDVRTPEDLESLLKGLPMTATRRFERQAASEGLLVAMRDQRQLQL